MQRPLLPPLNPWRASRSPLNPSLPSAIATKPLATKPIAAKPAELKPVALAQPAKAAVAAVAAAPVAPVQAAAATIKEAAAKIAPPVTLASLASQLPKPPAFADITVHALMAQTLTFARTFGALQGKMLDHVCGELKATLSDAEALARTSSAADAVALQAKAVRRGYDSNAAYLKDIAKIAAGPFRQG